MLESLKSALLIIPSVDYGYFIESSIVNKIILLVQRDFRENE